MCAGCGHQLAKMVLLSAGHHTKLAITWPASLHPQHFCRAGTGASTPACPSYQPSPCLQALEDEFDSEKSELTGAHNRQKKDMTDMMSAMEVWSL